MSERGIEWAAGLFEGEGSLHIQKNTQRTNQSWVLSLNLSMTDEDTVREFHRIVGVGGVYYSHCKSQRERGRKPLWDWRVRGHKAEELAWRLMPYLMQRRRARFTELIQELVNYRTGYVEQSADRAG